MEVYYHWFLNSPLNADEWPVSGLSNFTSGVIDSIINLIGGYAGPKAGLEAVAWRETLPLL
jgi:hypothetical protein